MVIIFSFAFCPPRHQLIGADAHLPAKMEDVAARKMLPLSATVLMAGLDVTVTSLGSHVRPLLAKEVLYMVIRSLSL